MQSRNVRYLPAIDHLRFAAAALILFFHSWPAFFGFLCRDQGLPVQLSFFQGRNPVLALLIEGHTAVALFMVLSGFIFTYGALGHTVHYFAFVKNRLLRIYPLYLFLLIVGTYALPATYTFTGFLQSLLCMLNLPGAVEPAPFGLAAWAISVEFQFYLLFPFLLRFFQERGSRWLLGLIACALLTRATALLHGANIRDLSYYTLVGRIDQFLIGMAAARWYVQRHEQLRRWSFLFPLGIVLVACTLWQFNAHGGFNSLAWWKVLWPTWEGGCWGVFLLGYLAVAPLLPRLLSVLLARLGEVSFSMYLLHLTLLSSLLRLNGYVRFGLGPALDAFLNAALLLLPATIALSFLTYHVIERPFLSLRICYLVEKKPSSVPIPSRLAG